MAENFEGKKKERARNSATKGNEEIQCLANEPLKRGKGKKKPNKVSLWSELSCLWGPLCHVLNQGLIPV